MSWSGLEGRPPWVGVQMSALQHAIRPSGARSALIRMVIAGPLRAQTSSSKRVHCTRTGRPSSCEMTAASAAASSAPLWP